MAKLKKRKLRWQPSKSPQVVGYRLYWSADGRLDYDSQAADLGNVTEIVLPDDIENFPAAAGPVELGLTAVDELGNESDIVTLRAPYQFNVPAPPTDLRLEASRQFFLHQARNHSGEGPQTGELIAAGFPDDESNASPFAELLPFAHSAGDK